MPELEIALFADGRVADADLKRTARLGLDALSVYAERNVLRGQQRVVSLHRALPVQPILFSLVCQRSGERVIIRGVKAFKVGVHIEHADLRSGRNLTVDTDDPVVIIEIVRLPCAVFVELVRIHLSGISESLLPIFALDVHALVRHRLLDSGRRLLRPLRIGRGSADGHDGEALHRGKKRRYAPAQRPSPILFLCVYVACFHGETLLIKPHVRAWENRNKQLENIGNSIWKLYSFT